MKTCIQCRTRFEVTDKDRAFYQRVSPVFSGRTYLIPEPDLCPRCRQQRRMNWRNEVNLFQTACAKTGNKILSMYAPDCGYTIYDQTEWWKDDWDPLGYGRDFDFSRPFFEQFSELQKVVPRMSLNCIGNENSYYTNYALRNKNSYLLTTADYNEDCYYGRFSQRNYKSVDFDFTNDSRVCYQTLDTNKSEGCMYCQKIENSSDLIFCYDMRGCHGCIFSSGLRNQDHMIFNKKVSKEEFKKFKNELKLNSRAGVKEAMAQARDFWKDVPHKCLETVQCEDCFGDYLKNSKNAVFCFDCKDLHDVQYGSQLENAKDSYDWDFFGHGELCYQMANCAYQLFNCRFCMNCWDGNSDLIYCDLCLGNEHLFGCIGMRKKKYCILNRQYTKDEYETLVPKIIEHMQKSGEWGQFFPASMSTFAYNDSVAADYFPLSKEEVLKRGLKWRETDKKDYQPQKTALPEDVNSIKEDIIKAVLTCSNCGKNYKILDQEIKYYKEFRLAVPDKCWLCRHKERMSLRNPRVLFNRNCQKCGTGIWTTYAPGKPEKIYCEKCYLREVA